MQQPGRESWEAFSSNQCCVLDGWTSFVVMRFLFAGTFFPLPFCIWAMLSSTPNLNVRIDDCFHIHGVKFKFYSNFNFLPPTISGFCQINEISVDGMSYRSFTNLKFRLPRACNWSEESHQLVIEWLSQIYFSGTLWIISSFLSVGKLSW